MKCRCGAHGGCFGVCSSSCSWGQGRRSVIAGPADGARRTRAICIGGEDNRAGAAGRSSSRHTLTLHPPAPCRRSQGAGDGECGKQRVEQEQRRERRGKPQKADRSRQVRCSSPRSGGPDGPRRRPGSWMLPGHPRRRRPPWKLQIGHPTEVAAQCEKRPFARGLRARATGRVTVSDPDEGSAEPSGDAGSARCSRSPETGFGCSRRMA